MKGTPEVRFWAKVGPHDDPNACWLWLAGTHKTPGKRYGVLRVAGKTVDAHVFSYVLQFGLVPEGLELDHLCRNTLCVNPGHLEPVLHRVNVLRGVGKAALEAKQTHCVHGHPFNEENTCFSKGHRCCRVCARIRSWKVWEIEKSNKKAQQEVCHV